MVRRDPMFPSIHSTCASASAAGPLGDQVVDVGGPVLDGRVGDARTLERHQLDDGRVQGVGRVHRGRAALDVVHLGALVGDDQGALELAHVLRVDPEVGLQGHLDLDAGRHVDERPARPHRRVEGGELVVVGWDEGAEPPADVLGVLPYRRVHVAEQHALLPRGRPGCGGRRPRSRTAPSRRRGTCARPRGCPTSRRCS